MILPDQLPERSSKQRITKQQIVATHTARLHVERRRHANMQQTDVKTCPAKQLTKATTANVSPLVSSVTPNSYVPASSSRKHTVYEPLLLLTAIAVRTLLRLRTVTNDDWLTAPKQFVCRFHACSFQSASVHHFHRLAFRCHNPAQRGSSSI